MHYRDIMNREERGRRRGGRGEEMIARTEEEERRGYGIATHQQSVLQ